MRMLRSHELVVTVVASRARGSGFNPGSHEMLLLSLGIVGREKTENLLIFNC